MPKIVDKEAKKLEILDAAMKVFAEKGFANTKMLDISGRAHIGKGTIYEYFSSKDDIFEYVFIHFMKTMEASVTDALHCSETPEEKIRCMFMNWANMVVQHSSDIMEVMLDFWAEAVRKKDERELGIVNLEKIYTDFRVIIQSILEEGIQRGHFRDQDAYHTASLMLGAMDGIMIQWILDKSHFDLIKVTEHSLDIFLSGIRMQSEE